MEKRIHCRITSQILPDCCPKWMSSEAWNSVQLVKKMRIFALSDSFFECILNNSTLLSSCPRTIKTKV